MMPSRNPSLQRLYRAAAVVAVCVFVSAPTLARLHDRLLINDNAAGFRLSRNIERPHEKQTAAPLAPRASQAFDRLLVVVGHAPVAAEAGTRPPLLHAESNRAPPVR